MTTIIETGCPPSGIDRVIDEYAGAARPELPIGGYAAIVAAFAGLFGVLLVRAAARHSVPARIAAGDVVLLGIATHKLTRILTRDWVTIPLRFGFTRYVQSDGAGEVIEKARGRGLQRALGDLLTCSFCTGPWVASGLTAGIAARPRETRIVASTLAMITISDFLHHAYARTKRLSA